MSKQTIIDWQTADLLVATSAGRGAGTKLDRVSRQSLEDENGDSRSAAAALSAAVEQLKVAKSQATVIASREMVEVRTLNVPHMAADELPDVIRFQAQRQLANMADNWTLDYVMLPPEPGQEMQTALVGAISPENMAAIDSACTTAGLQLNHIALAPIEIARFAVSSGKLSSGTSLAVCVSQQQADFLLLKSGQVVLVRSTKLPTEGEQLSSALSGEVRRSLVAASNQLGSSSFDGVLLFATPQISNLVEQAIADATGTVVTVVDPTDYLPKKLEDRDDIAATSSSRIAAMLGTSSLPTADKKTLLDFKNPKRRPPKKKNTARLALAGAAAVLVLFAGVSWYYATNKALDNELEDYQTFIADKEELVKTARRKMAQLDEVEKFLDGSPNFLDELTYIAKNMPPSNEVILGGPSFSTRPDGTGEIRVPIAADSDSSISLFEASLRDENHALRVRDQHISDRPTDLYKWQAVETITISGRGWDLLDDAPGNATADDVAKKEMEGSGEDADASADESGNTDADESAADNPEAADHDAGNPEAGDEDATNENSKSSEESDSESSTPEPDDNKRAEVTSPSDVTTKS